MVGNSTETELPVGFSRLHGLGATDTNMVTTDSESVHLAGGILLPNSQPAPGSLDIKQLVKHRTGVWGQQLPLESRLC